MGLYYIDVQRLFFQRVTNLWWLKLSINQSIAQFLFWFQQPGLQTSLLLVAISAPAKAVVWYPSKANEHWRTNLALLRR
jgi:hypothetical protein